MKSYKLSISSKKMKTMTDVVPRGKGYYLVDDLPRARQEENWQTGMIMGALWTLAGMLLAAYIFFDALYKQFYG